MAADPSVPLNRELAFAAVQVQPDPELRAVLQEDLEVATARFLKWDHLSDDEFAQQLPTAPFDMLFYVRLLERLFAHRTHLFRTLDGPGADPFSEPTA